MLHAFRLTGVVYARSHLTAPWGISLPPMPGCLVFHVVTAGRCVLDGLGSEAVVLRPGEFALLPHGEGHSFKSGPDARVENYFDLPLSTLRLMGVEAGASLPGGETIVTRLADILVIQSIRAWLSDNPDRRAGWLGALSDERIGPALVRIQREPEKDGTVASLAASVSMSRSAFSARFAELVGEPPLQHVTRWRMRIAGSWLLEGRMTASECGARLGYNSEAAFNRAFKRVMGLPPGAWRAQQRV
jgi:AraC-like DNA-binding protein